MIIIMIIINIIIIFLLVFFSLGVDIQSTVSARIVILEELVNLHFRSFFYLGLYLFAIHSE